MSIRTREQLDKQGMGQPAFKNRRRLPTGLEQEPESVGVEGDGAAMHVAEQMDGLKRGEVEGASADEGVVVEGGRGWDLGEEGEGAGEGAGRGIGEGFEEVGG